MKSILITIFALFLNTLCISVSSAQLSDALMLTVSNGRYSDQTAVRFLDEATNSFDSEYDAYKLRNRGLTPNFSSNIDGLNYSINAVHGGGNLIDLTVPLNLEVAFNGVYVLTAEEIGLFDSTCTITLIDNVLREEFDLRANSTYRFLFYVGDATDRFYLKFKSTPPAINSSKDQFADAFTSGVDNSNSSTQAVNVFDSEGKILVKVNQAQAPILVHISDLAGNTVANTTINSATQWEFAARQSELYIVSLVVDGVMHTEKVFVQ